MPTSQKNQSLKRFKPVQRAKQIYQAFREFTLLEASGGIVLILAAGLALVWANSPWSAQYYAFWQKTISFGFENHRIAHDLHWWINEALMIVFFFVVGLEIKREVLVGELASLRQATLPIAAAVGGMVFPALIFTALNFRGPGASGWGVPMATDIAFALGVMALVGARVPLALKVFLTALAIVDDIGAVVVIALFYTSSVSWLSLGIAAGILLILIALNRLSVRNLSAYCIFGILLWLAILNSGVHATLAGILLAFTIPASRKVNRTDFLHRARSYLQAFEHAGEANPRLLSAHQQEALIALETVVEDVEAPLQKLEHAFHPWVTYLIIPLFALANAGVSLKGNIPPLFFDSVSLGVIAGLILGKQTGITLAAWLVVKLGLAELPQGVRWRHIYAVGWLAGIGFTMSLFISELAFNAGGAMDSAKVGILGASIAAGLVGYVLLKRFVQTE
jgi:Na+:H+ antiporter, NhaA family